MNQTPRQQNDDLRLSDDEIRAMSDGLRSQFVSRERGMVGSVGSAVVGGLEGTIRRVLIFLRLPLIALGGLIGFFLLNGREGVSFPVALIAAVVAAFIAAAIIGALVRFIELRAYRREIG